MSHASGPEARGAVLRLDSLTGLRACAALGVFVWHAGVGDNGTVAGVAVSFFFVLSGFVLMWVGDERVGARRFYRKRVARLLPAYLVTWVGGIVLSVALNFHESIGAAVAGALLLQSWVPDMSWYYSYNGVAWSLSCEAFFYATFPLWAPALAAAPRRIRLTAGGVALLGMIIVAVVTELHTPYSSITVWPDNSVAEWLIRTFPPTRLLEFFLGAVLAVEMRAGWRFPIPLLPIVVLVVFSYLVLCQIHGRWGANIVTILPLIALVGAAAQADLDGRRTVFKSRLLVWGGGISYSFYLSHQLVVHVLGFGISSDPRFLGSVGLVAAVATAAALHYWVDRPMNAGLRGGPARAASSVGSTANP